MDASDETIMRFNCKMALLWSPSAGGRFAFADNSTRYFTACTFEEHMWHHAYVAIGEDGRGQLFVDGAAMQLQVPADINAADYAAGFVDAPLGDAFLTHMFPSFCPQGSAAHIAQFATGKRRSARRRQLLSLASSSEEGSGGEDAEAEEEFESADATSSWGAGPDAGSVERRRKLLTVPEDSDVSLFTGFNRATNLPRTSPPSPPPATSAPVVSLA